MFSARERSQLDVYGIWAVTRNQLHTDDSFTFNRMITRIKESVSHLSEADEEEETALQAIKVRLLLLIPTHTFTVLLTVFHHSSHSIDLQSCR